jgi:nicotinamide mononucleotide transporter
LRVDGNYKNNKTNMIINFLSINNIFFSAFGYDMSYLEFFGTILNIVSVYLVSKNKILNWPIGIVASVLFMFLFWQIQLYSDFTEQIYYIITGFWGWFAWSTNRQVNSNLNIEISKIEKSEYLKYFSIVTVGSIFMGYFMTNIDKIFTFITLEPASYPYLDAFTTVLSFLATYLLIIRKIESWYIWIFVDVIAIWLYFVKGVVFVSLLYVVFLCLASFGLINWIKIYKTQK